MQCAAHPSVDTELGCSKCGKPICPRCLIQTPVGARCRECANVRRLPSYNISLVYLLRGLAAALVAGAAAGGLWGLLIPNPSIFGALFVGFGVGYLVGESVSRATNRKAGPPLQALAAAGILVAYLVRTVILASDLRHVGIVDIVTDDLYGYLAVGAGVFIAIGRLR